MLIIWKDHYTLGFFIDLSKAFDAVDHIRLIKKRKIYGINCIKLACFRSYLKNRIKYMWCVTWYLVPCAQFKKREKHPWRSVTFSKVANWSLQLKVTLLHGDFSCFLNCTNGTKLREAPHISINHELETDTQNILCGVPEGSILGLLLFLLYVIDLHNSSALDTIMFPDDTNLFEHKDLKTVFSLVNQELQKINEWFEEN